MILRACKKCGTVQAVTHPLNPPTHNCPVCDYRLFVDVDICAGPVVCDIVVPPSEEELKNIALRQRAEAAEKAKAPKGPKA